jgi:hypothetical protein
MDLFQDPYVRDALASRQLVDLCGNDHIGQRQPLQPVPGVTIRLQSWMTAVNEV